MKKLLFLLPLLMVACTSHNSKIDNFKVNQGEFTVPVQQEGCGWILVDETFATQFLGFKMGATSRQYNKSLYYCCPGDSNPEPICYQSQWVSK